MMLYVNMTKDDTFIFLQFVRNMLVNHEMSFNVGEPTYGFTSVIWTFLLFCVGKISPYLLVNAKILSSACSIGAILFLYLLCKKVLDKPLWQFAATFAFSLNPVFVYISCSGMETSLAILLAISGIWAYLKERDEERIIYISPIIFSLAYLTRPEMLLLFVLVFVDLLVNSKCTNKIKIIAIFLLQYAFVIAPWLLVAWYNFGTVIPNPIIIKAVRSLTDYQLSYIAKRLLLILGSMHTADMVLGIVCCGFLLWSKRLIFFYGFFKTNLLLILWIVGLVASYIFQKVSVSPRYLLIISPFVTVIVFKFLEDIEKHFSLKRDKVYLVLIATIFIGQSFVATLQIYYPHAQSYNAKDQVLKEVALWLRDNTLKDASVASIDIGILGYYSKRKIVDITGLINPDKIKTPLTIDYLKKKNVGYYLDRQQIPFCLIKNKVNSSKWNLKPLMYRSAQSSGWHYNMVEDQVIGFSLYQIAWK